MNNNDLFLKMCAYYKGDPHQIQHLLKVMAYSNIIAQKENVNEDVRFILEAAAIVHDIGIKPSLELYDDDNGDHQQTLGYPLALQMLESLNYPLEVRERVAYLVGHHHTYINIDGIDYQILVEADFLVNIDENHKSYEYAQLIKNTIFKTKTGIEILDSLFA